MFFGIFIYIIVILSVLLNNKAFFINEEFLIFICFLFFGFIILKLVKKFLIYYLFFEIKTIYIYFQFLILGNIRIIDKIIFIFNLLNFKFFFNLITEYLFSIINFYNVYLQCEKFKLLFIKNMLISSLLSYLDIKLYYLDFFKKFINQINYKIIDKLVIFSIYNMDKLIKKYII
jgi:hypothetical protein